MTLSYTSFAFASIAETSDDFDISITPAWDGLYRESRHTEIQINLSKLSPQNYVFTLTGGKTPVKGYIPIKSSQTELFIIPVQFSNQNNLLLSIENSVGKSVLSKKIWFSQIIKSSRVLVEPVPENLQKNLVTKINNYQLYKPTTSSFPYQLAALDMVDALLLTYAALQNLNEKQLNVLLDYLGSCGQIITLNLPDSVYARLQKYVVCDASQLQKIESRSQLEGALLILDESIRASDDELISLGKKVIDLDVNQKKTRLISVFFGIYLLLFLASIILSKRSSPPLIISVCFSAFFYFFWESQASEVNVFNWVEVNDQQSLARVRSLVSFSGNVKSVNSYLLTHDTWLINRVDADENSWISYDERKAINTKNTLFSNNEYLLKTNILFKNPIQIRQFDNIYHVINTGNISIGPGLLISKIGTYYFSAIPAESEASVSKKLSENLSPILQQIRKWNIDSADGIQIFVSHKTGIWEFINSNTIEQGWLHIKNIETVGS